MLLESDYVVAKLKVDLHPGFLSLVTFNRASQAERAIFEALTIAEDATTTHARRLVVHGESVHHSLHLLESVALDISSLLATELASVNQEKEEIKCRVSTIFGMQRGSLRTLKGRLADLRCINNFWGEARDFLSLAIHVFNGVRSDLVALSEYQMGHRAVRLHVPPEEQYGYFKRWTGRLEARRVFKPALR